MMYLIVMRHSTASSNTQQDVRKQQSDWGKRKPNAYVSSIIHDTSASEQAIPKLKVNYIVFLLTKALILEHH